MCRSIVFPYVFWGRGSEQDIEVGCSMKAALSRLGVAKMPVTVDDMVQTLQYVTAASEFALDLHIVVKAQMRLFRNHWRTPADILFGTVIGESAANAWGIVFGNDPNVAYFLYPA